MDRIKDNIIFMQGKMLENLINLRLRLLDSSCYCFMHVLLIFFDLTEFFIVVFCNQLEAIVSNVKCRGPGK